MPEQVPGLKSEASMSGVPKGTNSGLTTCARLTGEYGTMLLTASSCIIPG